MMSVHYSDQRALASAQAKRQVLQCFFALARAHPAAASAIQGGSCLSHGSFTWEHVAQLQQLHSPTTASQSTSSLTTSPHAANSAASSSWQEVDHRPHRVKKDKKAKKAKKADKKRKREEEDSAHPEARLRPPRGHPPSPA